MFFLRYENITIDNTDKKVSISYKDVIEYLGESPLSNIEDNSLIVIGTEEEIKEENVEYIYIKEGSIKNGIFISSLNDDTFYSDTSDYRSIYDYLLDKLFEIHNIDLEEEYNKIQLM